LECGRNKTISNSDCEFHIFFFKILGIFFRGAPFFLIFKFLINDLLKFLTFSSLDNNNVWDDILQFVESKKVKFFCQNLIDDTDKLL